MGLSTDASNKVFNNIAARYDLVNAFLSFGFHQSWRVRLAQALPAQTTSVLDLACGTAAIPLALARYRDKITNIVGVDISENMLTIGKTRVSKAVADRRINLLQGDALDLPMGADTFDAVTVGFALRNVPDIMRLFITAYRVLKPSGSFAVLEFSRPKGGLAVVLHSFYLGFMVPLAGLLLTGNWAAYQHLGRSILSFPDRNRFLRMFCQAGFKDVCVTSMAFGAVTLYLAKKDELPQVSLK